MNERKQYITVVKWKFPHTNGTYDQSYIGECLEVISKDDNLLLVNNIRYFHNTPFILNTDKVETRTVKEYFAKAILDINKK